MSATTEARPTVLGSPFACAVCEGVGEWRVIGKNGQEKRGCTPHLGEVASDVPADGFQPLVLVRVFGGSPTPGGAA